MPEWLIGAIVGAILGGFFTLILGLPTYKKLKKIEGVISKTEQEKRESIPIFELNQIIQNKTIGPDGNYKACPECGYKRLRNTPDMGATEEFIEEKGKVILKDEEGVEFLHSECPKCGWSNFIS